MSFSYTYSISQDIPGGVFNGNISSRIFLLITEKITTQLITINSGGDVLTVVFLTELSTKEKTILDGDTANPAGGIIGASADFIEITHSEKIVNNFDRIVLTADGIQSAVFSTQLKNGFGVDIKGETEQQVFASAGLAPVNKSKDNLDESGAASFVIGPSFDRGVIEVTVETKNLPDRFFEVQFE